MARGRQEKQRPDDNRKLEYELLLEFRKLNVTLAAILKVMQTQPPPPKPEVFGKIVLGTPVPQ